MKSDLSQKAQRKFFERQGEEPWTVIYDSVFESGSVNYGIYCALSDPDQRDRALGDPGWDLTVTDGAAPAENLIHTGGRRCLGEGR